jgi:phosphotransferase system enzyme I (PtsI)
MVKKVLTKEIKPEIALKGIPASPGIAIGPVYIYSEPTLIPELRIVPDRSIQTEINRFENAILAGKKSLEKLADQTIKYYGKESADILQTQIDILEDKIFLNEVEQLIKEKKFDAAYATYQIFQNKREHFLKLSDEYFRERAFDVQSLKRLVLREMLGKKTVHNVTENSIVIADNISPADTIRLHHRNILGFCTNVGGKNSHTAIVARSLGVPAVVGTEFVTDVVKAEDVLILDGNQGIIIVNPGHETIQDYTKKQKQFIILEKDLLKTALEPASTTDGQLMTVMGNIEFAEELEQLKKSGAEGIGLYRTEGLFLGGNGLPSEDLQTENYLKFAEALKPKTVVIRTLDIGGDKLLPDIVGIPERNPFLGWRAIRFCLDHKEIFLPQLKAILRANIHGNVHILLPMVSSLEEIRQFKMVFAEAQNILKKEGKKYKSDIKLGIMVEIPSAAILAETFVKEVDFFSIGTNDLVQYTLAVDRANEKISRLYNQYHPALLNLIEKVIDVGKKTKTSVSMCGEMAGDPVAVPLLIGVGLTIFSAAQIAIPQIKNVIRNLSGDDCQTLYEKSKKLKTATEIQKLCEDFYARLNHTHHHLDKKN